MKTFEHMAVDAAEVRGLRADLEAAERRIVEMRDGLERALDGSERRIVELRATIARVRLLPAKWRVSDGWTPSFERQPKELCASELEQALEVEREPG